MTGFGQGIAERGNVRATVDVRAVNHRFLDLKLRGSVAPAIEEAIASRVRAVLERGAVTVSLHVERLDAPAGSRIDPAAARAAHASLSELARTLGIAGPDLALVLAQPGVVAAEDVDRSDGATAAVIAAVE